MPTSVPRGLNFLMMEIDFFKENGASSHGAGDKVLKQLPILLQREFRKLVLDMGELKYVTSFPQGTEMHW